MSGSDQDRARDIARMLRRAQGMTGWLITDGSGLWLLEGARGIEQNRVPLAVALMDPRPPALNKFPGLVGAAGLVGLDSTTITNWSLALAHVPHERTIRRLLRGGYRPLRGREYEEIADVFGAARTTIKKARRLLEALETDSTARVASLDRLLSDAIIVSNEGDAESAPLAPWATRMLPFLFADSADVVTARLAVEDADIRAVLAAAMVDLRLIPPVCEEPGKGVPKLRLESTLNLVGDEPPYKRLELWRLLIDLPQRVFNDVTYLHRYGVSLDRSLRAESVFAGSGADCDYDVATFMAKGKGVQRWLAVAEALRPTAPSLAWMTEPSVLRLFERGGTVGAVLGLLGSADLEQTDAADLALMLRTFAAGSGGKTLEGRLGDLEIGAADSERLDLAAETLAVPRGELEQLARLRLLIGHDDVLNAKVRAALVVADDVQQERSTLRVLVTDAAIPEERRHQLRVRLERLESADVVRARTAAAGAAARRSLPRAISTARRMATRQVLAELGRDLARSQLEIPSTVDWPDEAWVAFQLVGEVPIESFKMWLAHLTHPDTLATVPANRGWLEEFAGDGGDVARWLEGFDTEVEVAGSVIRYHTEKDSFEALRLGSYFDTCLSLNDFNREAALSNTVELNKHVVYGRRTDGAVVCRKLIGVASDRKLAGYRTYAAADKTEHRAALQEVLAGFAGDCGLTLDDDATPASLTDLYWYDDGNEPWESNRTPTDGDSDPSSRHELQRCEALLAGLPYEPRSTDIADQWAAWRSYGVTARTVSDHESSRFEWLKDWLWLLDPTGHRDVVGLGAEFEALPPAPDGRLSDVPIEQVRFLRPTTATFEQSELIKLESLPTRAFLRTPWVLASTFLAGLSDHRLGRRAKSALMTDTTTDLAAEIAVRWPLPELAPHLADALVERIAERERRGDRANVRVDRIVEALGRCRAPVGVTPLSQLAARNPNQPLYAWALARCGGAVGWRPSMTQLQVDESELPQGWIGWARRVPDSELVESLYRAARRAQREVLHSGDGELRDERQGRQYTAMATLGRVVELAAELALPNLRPSDLDPHSYSRHAGIHSSYWWRLREATDPDGSDRRDREINKDAHWRGINDAPWEKLAPISGLPHRLLSGDQFWPTELTPVILKAVLTDPESLPAIHAALRSGDPDVRHAAARAVADLATCPRPDPAPEGWVIRVLEEMQWCVAHAMTRGDLEIAADGLWSGLPVPAIGYVWPQIRASGPATAALFLHTALGRLSLLQQTSTGSVYAVIAALEADDDCWRELSQLMTRDLVTLQIAHGVLSMWRPDRAQREVADLIEVLSLHRLPFPLEEGWSWRLQVALLDAKFRTGDEQAWGTLERLRGSEGQRANSLRAHLWRGNQGS